MRFLKISLKIDHLLLRGNFSFYSERGSGRGRGGEGKREREGEGEKSFWATRECVGHLQNKAKNNSKLSSRRTSNISFSYPSPPSLYIRHVFFFRPFLLKFSYVSHTLSLSLSLPLSGGISDPLIALHGPYVPGRLLHSLFPSPPPLMKKVSVGCGWVMERGGWVWPCIWAISLL